MLFRSLKRRAPPPPPRTSLPTPTAERALQGNSRSAKPSYSPPVFSDAHRLLMTGPSRRGSAGTGEKEATIVEKGLSAMGLQLRRPSLAAMGVLKSTSSVTTSSKESPGAWGENVFARAYSASTDVRALPLFASSHS